MNKEKIISKSLGEHLADDEAICLHGKIIYNAMTQYAIYQKIELLEELHSDIYNTNASFRAAIRTKISDFQQQLQKLKDGK